MNLVGYSMGTALTNALHNCQTLETQSCIELDLREYAILAMKNILTGNPQNQALIEELQPIEAVDHPALEEARITAKLDAETGRPVLTQRKP